MRVEKVNTIRLKTTAVVALVLLSLTSIAQIFYSTNFENGASDWTTGYASTTCQANPNVVGCSWVLTDSCAGTTKLSLGSKAYGTLNDGALGAENSWIRTPSVFVTTGNVRLDFDSWTANESGFPCYYDAEFVEMTQDGGLTWTTIHSYVSGLHDYTNDRTWRRITLNATVTPNTNISFRFRFDSGDDHSDLASRGWYIDNVEIRSGYSFTFTKNDVQCEGTNTGSIVFNSVTGGATPYRYSINGGTSFTTSATFNYLAAGNYNLIVRDALNRLTATVPVTIVPTKTVNTTVSPSGSVSICEGGQLTLNAFTASGYTHQWRRNNSVITGATQATYTATMAGSYTVTSTFNGCTRTSTAVVVNIGASPTFNTTTQATCTGLANGSITFTSATGTAPILYSINNGATFVSTPEFNGLSAGNYQTVIKDASNCASVATVTEVPTINDVWPPVVKVKNIEVELNEDGTAIITPTDVDDGTFDNCAVSGLDLSKKQFNANDLGKRKVAFKAWDPSNNLAVDSVEVTVKAKQPLAKVKDITVYLNQNGAATIDASSINDGSAFFTSLSVSPGAFTCANLGKNTVTLTAMGLGNSVSTATAIVTVVDAMAPSLTLTPATVYLSNGTATLLNNQVITTANDNCGSVVLVVSKTQFTDKDLGNNTITVTATDANGNSSSANTTVTVQLGAPVAKAKNINVFLNANGIATLSAADVNDGSDNVVSMSVSPSTFNCGNIGSNQVVLTVLGVNGAVATANATVTVQENNAPTVLTKNATLTLLNGAATLTASQINNGSFDNCAIASISVSPNAFTTANLGTNTVTLTVTDVNGNVATSTANVTVLSGVVTSCNIYLVRGVGPNTNGPLNTIYLGYGPQNITLQAVVTGTAPFTYTWSGASGLSSTTNSSTVFTPTAVGTYTINCSVNTLSGTASSSVTICVIEARDLSSSNQNKILVCRNNGTNSVNITAVQAQLNQPNARLGSCSSGCGSFSKNETTDVITQVATETNVLVYPNPSQFGKDFTIVMASESTAPVSIQVYDIKGTLVAELYNQPANQEIHIGSALHTGLYFAKVVQGDYTKTVRISKVN